MKVKLSLIACVLGLVAFVGMIILAVQFHHIKKTVGGLEQSNTALTLSVTDLNRDQLSINTARNLASASLLANVQTLFMQGVPASQLLKNAAPLWAFLEGSSNPAVKTLAIQLKTELQALPEVNLPATFQQLDQLKASLATLSFALPVSQVITSVGVVDAHSHWSTKLWQQLRGLLVVRTQNQIGADLVTNTARFDAVRHLNLLMDELKWQLMTAHDPAPILNELKADVVAYTADNAAQSAWLLALNTAFNVPQYYSTAQIQAVLTTIATLEAALAQPA